MNMALSFKGVGSLDSYIKKSLLRKWMCVSCAAHVKDAGDRLLPRTSTWFPKDNSRLSRPLLEHIHFWGWNSENSELGESVGNWGNLWDSCTQRIFIYGFVARKLAVTWNMFQALRLMDVECTAAVSFYVVLKLSGQPVLMRLICFD